MQTLNQDIKERRFRRVYLLFGEEPFLVSSYKKRLREAISGDDTMPFFAERRLIMVDESGFFKGAAPEELADYIPELPETTCLVFCET